MAISMKFSLIAITVISYAIYSYVSDNLYTKLPLHYDSNTVDERFQLVSEVFRKNFADGWEHGGAALAVYFKGQKVLDIWGGYADIQAARKWKIDTITATFSCLKGVMALCVAMLVDQKLVNYDDLITKYWPHFGKNGKANITVQMILSHMAGLAYLDEPFDLGTAANHQEMRKIFENERPKWPPGRESGYHQYSFYWLIDQLIRHIDKEKRGIQEYFHDEIASKFGIDYSIGLSMTEEYRVARVTMPSWIDILGEIYQTPHLIQFFLFHSLQDSFICKGISNLKWLHPATPLQINNPNFHSLLYHGFGNARSLAKIFHMLLTGNVLSPATQLLLNKFFINSTDVCLLKQLAKGNGFMYFNINRAKVLHAYGHSGFGCQQVLYDNQNDIIIAYTTNDIKFGTYEECRTYIRLQNAIYDVVEKLNPI